MILYKLYHDGTEVLFFKEAIHVTCTDLHNNLVQYKNKTYKIGVPVLDGLKVCYMIEDEGNSDEEVISAMKNYIITTLQGRINNFKAALREWEVSSVR